MLINDKEERFVIIKLKSTTMVSSFELYFWRLLLLNVNKYSNKDWNNKWVIYDNFEIHSLAPYAQNVVAVVGNGGIQFPINAKIV